MKFFVAILGLTTIIMAVREAASDDSSESTTAKMPSFDYALNISIVSNSAVSNDIIDTSKWVTEHVVVYNKKVDSDNPIFIIGNVFNSKFQEVAAFPTTNILDPCIGHVSGTWEHVLVQTIAKSLIPEGKCPIEPGKYDINACEGVSVSATFRDIIDCGRYLMNIAIIDSKYNVITQATFGFDTSNLGDEYQCK